MYWNKPILAPLGLCPTNRKECSAKLNRLGAVCEAGKAWKHAIYPPKLGGQARSAGWFLSDPLETQRLRNHPACAAGSRTAYCPPNLGGAVRDRAPQSGG